MCYTKKKSSQSLAVEGLTNWFKKNHFVPSLYYYTAIYGTYSFMAWVARVLVLFLKETNRRFTYFVFILLKIFFFPNTDSSKKDHFTSLLWHVSIFWHSFPCLLIIMQVK